MKTDNKYRFAITTDKNGHKMLACFYDELDPSAIANAKYVTPQKFIKELSALTDMTDIDRRG